MWIAVFSFVLELEVCCVYCTIQFLKLNYSAEKPTEPTQPGCSASWSRTETPTSYCRYFYLFIYYKKQPLHSSPYKNGCKESVIMDVSRKTRERAICLLWHGSLSTVLLALPRSALLSIALALFSFFWHKYSFSYLLKCMYQLNW